MNVVTAYRDELLALLEAMNAGQNQNWEVQWSIYDILLMRWPEPLASRVVTHAALNCRWRPTPVELREIAAKLESPVPTADAALQEIEYLKRRYGVNAQQHPDYPNIFLPGAPSYSHPLIAATVKRLGGWAAVNEEDAQFQQGGAQGHFKTVYERAAEEWQEKVMTALDSGLRPPELFPFWEPFKPAQVESAARQTLPRKSAPQIAAQEKPMPYTLRSKVLALTARATMPRGEA